VRFGPFKLLVEIGELRKDGVRLKLSGPPIQVLAPLGNSTLNKFSSDHCSFACSAYTCIKKVYA